MGDAERIIDCERRFLLETYARYPVVFQRGAGVFLYDLQGKRYLDFVAGLGVNALGHAHPRIVKTIREQAARLPPGIERDEMLKRASQADTAAHLDDWANSRGLQPPT